MIPPSPLQFTLWGSALYTELATGLWRALAAPWLQPGWPGAACAPGHHEGPRPRPEASTDEQHPAAVGARDPSRLASASEHRVIEVPPARWQHRRGREGRPSTEG